MLFVGALAVLLGGCPADENGTPNDSVGDNGGNGDGSTAQVIASAPETARAGDTVTLSADVEGADSANATFNWYQIFGYAVSLSSATGRTITFQAPAIANAQTLRFRVDVEVGGKRSSAETQVRINAQPVTEAPDDTTDDPTDDDPTPVVRIETTMGDILVELNRDKAPISVRNFLRYVDDGFYEGTLFHRVVPDFVIQGGGFGEDMIQKETRPAIKNESDNGLKNDRGTIAMARLSELDSATAQFYFNLKDNDDLNATPGTNSGYAVFGMIVKGLDVMDAIGAVETETRNGLSDIPVENILIERVVRLTEEEAAAEVGNNSGGNSGGAGGGSSGGSSGGNGTPGAGGGNRPGGTVIDPG